MRRADVVVLIVLFAIGAGLALPGLATNGDDSSTGAAPASTASPSPDELVEPGVESSKLWPYTSRTRSPAGRTLAINVVIEGDEAAVRSLLTDRTDSNWTTVERDQDVGVDTDATPWRSAIGAARYSYVQPANASTGTWVESSYQLGAGSYLGKRYHVRAYPTPTGNWTAVQAHAEYWDWYRLRHTVTDIESAGAFVEEDLEEQPTVARVTHQYHGRTRGWSDGWLIVVELATIALTASVLVDRRFPGWVLTQVRLAGAVVGIVLGVRGLGITAEALAPGLSPKVIAGILYPALVIGPPMAVARFGRSRDPGRTALVAGFALATGIVLDALSVGITHAPNDLLRHRVLLVTAFCLLAFGITRGDRRTMLVGIGAWVALLAAPLFDIV